MKILRPETPDALLEKFQTTRRELSESLIERDHEVDLALTALIAHEHLLLVSPPGCAKSLLLDSLLQWLDGGSRFNVLLTKFTTVEEVMGPISLSALKKDRFRRVTTSRLPEAHLAFVDEVFKASSAILNCLLRILNERTFENDGEVNPVPLLLCVAASNEWPSPESGQELNALADRFLFRKEVRPITSGDGRSRLLWATDHTPRLSTRVTPAEIHEANRRANSLPWTDAAKQALEAILRELAKEGVRPGDRRQFKGVKAARAFAWLEGAERVEPEHLSVLQHVLWDAPEEQPAKCAKVIAKIANPVGMRVHQLLSECEQILASCEVKNLAQAATAAAKLGEIERQFAGMKGNGRLERARTYVKDQIRKLKLASLEAV